MCFNDLTIHLRSAVFYALSSAMLFCNEVGLAAVSNDYEAIACANATMGTSADPLKCSEAGMGFCEAPDWYPVSFASQYESIDDGSKRTNTVTTIGYAVYRHTWTSARDLPYGPALSAASHEWSKTQSGIEVNHFTCGADTTPVDKG